MEPAPLGPWLTGDPAAGQPATDGLSLRPVAFVPEVALFLAEDPTLLWARLEAAEGRRLGPPFWASAWSGGQALARYVLDHPELVAGRRVLDIASGSGLVAIAAARAGAASVLANDVDPYAAAAIVTNARANEVDVTAVPHDVLDGDGEGAEVILAGDALYEAALAVRVLAFLDRVAARGVLVLAGDPGRGHVPEGRLDRLAEYDELHLGPADDHRERRPAVFRARGRQP